MGEQRVSRFESFAQLVALSVFLLWLLSVHGSPELIADPATAVVRLGPAWNQMYLPLVLLTLVSMMQACVNWFRPDWMWLRSVVHVGGGIAWLILMSYLLMAIRFMRAHEESALKSRRLLAAYENKRAKAKRKDAGTPFTRMLSTP